MSLWDDLLTALPDGEVLQVRIGLHWTAVVVDLEGEQRCGLASTLSGEHNHHSEPDVPEAGYLEDLPGLKLAALARSAQPTLVSVGMATINALLPHQPKTWLEQNAEELIARHGAGKRVVLVGHFPFVSRLRRRVGELIVLENRPQAGDLPASAALEIIPSADVVAVTAMTLLNHTLEGILALCKSQTPVIVLGPSTPLSPVLFDYGVKWLCGSLVTNIEPVLQAVGQGANFRQVHRAGVRLVCIARPGFTQGNAKTGLTQ
jgi:uncharacterized protein (DUF4213/DUF364 family)